MGHGLTRDTATEDRVFSLQTPSSFFTFFGSLGGAASGDLAMEAFEDDVKVVGRTVSRVKTHHCALAVLLIANSPSAAQRPRYSQ
jgi:hypothetical protein